MAILSRRERPCRRAGLLALAACALFAAAAPAQEPTLEARVKAAYLFNFAKFVVWPQPVQSAPARPFVIGLLGDSPVLPALRALEGQQVHQRPVAIRQYERAADVDCDLLFVDASQIAAFARDGESIRRRPILTVGETDAFLLAGGAIGLVLTNGNVRYLVRPRAAEAVGLSISSKLLKLAERVLD